MKFITYNIIHLGKKAVTTKKVTEQLEDLDVGDTEQRFDYDSEEEKEKENDIGEGSETQQDKGKP